MRKQIFILVALIVGSVSFLSATVVMQDTNRTDKYGRKHGYWKKYETGILRYEGSFIHGKPHGLFTYYHDEGMVKSTVIYADSGSTARTVMFHKNGNIMAIGKYTNRRKDSVWKYYNSNELLMIKETYVKGVLHGEMVGYYENGKPFESMIYRNNKPNGAWKQFYRDGSIKLESNLIDDEAEGPLTIYHSNGAVAIKGTYKEDLPDGIWVYFTPKNEIIKKEHYNDGVLLKTERFIEEEHLESKENLKSIEDFRMLLKQFNIE